MINSKFFEATAVLIGTIVGAGIFSLPYAFSKSGFLIGAFYILIISLVLLITKFCYGEIVLRTKDRLEMVGYIERYLGKIGRLLITFSFLLGVTATLIIYIIGVGKFLNSLFSPIFGGNPLIYSLIFWFLVSLTVLKGIKIVSRLELLMSCLLILVAFFIFFTAIPYLNINNLNLPENFGVKNLFFPYGVVLFALGGASAIPTMRRILTNQEALLKKAIILGLFIPAIIYLVFSLTVLGVTGLKTSEEAILGLSQIVDGKIVLLGAGFGVLTMTTSFLALGYVLREVYRRDWKIPLFYSWVLAVFVPLILFLLGVRSFIGVIAFAGGILSGLTGILIILAFYQAKIKGDRQPEYNFNLSKIIGILVCLIFLLGIVYQIIY